MSAHLLTPEDLEQAIEKIYEDHTPLSGNSGKMLLWIPDDTGTLRRHETTAHLKDIAIAYIRSHYGRKYDSLVAT